MYDLHSGQGLALRAAFGLFDAASVDGALHAVRAHEAAEEGALQVRDDGAAAHHHALDAHQLVDVLQQSAQTE